MDTLYHLMGQKTSVQHCFKTKNLKIGIFKQENLQVEHSESKNPLLQKRTGNESATSFHYELIIIKKQFLLHLF